ncbi:hypothetical protein PF004_g32453 [Phytophthora fragariae]|uniref:Uncharacterized protein n=1 Tax=Phytophthora fragariae TaxID=53985 RepID=A0A6G0M7U3_9STRA|nr:hypothetical protein PF004_g32453 [Phytophthora fragariae]
MKVELIAVARVWEVTASRIMLLGLLHSGLAVVLRLETLSLTLYTVVVVVLLKQHLAAPRPWASEVVVLRKQHLAATRPWALEVPADSVLLLLKQHSDMVATQPSASVVPINPILALL